MQAESILERMERLVVLRYFRLNKYNTARTAKVLDMDVGALRRRFWKYKRAGFEVPGFKFEPRKPKKVGADQSLPIYAPINMRRKGYQGWE